MRNQFLFPFIVATLLSFLWLAPETAHADTTITLDKAIHVITTEGSDVVLEQGMYDLEPAEEWLRITPSGGTAVDALLIEAEVGNHEESVKAPMALSDTGETPDSHHIVLMLPDGKKYETVGTYSGLRSRGRSFRLSRKRLQTLMASRQRARSTEFETPLLGGGGGKRRYNLDCGPNGVVVGVTTKSGSWIDALGLICQEVNRNGSLGEDYTRRAVGGSGGTGRISRCRNGRVVGGLHARSGMFINGITMYCPRWDPAKKQPRKFSSTKNLRAGTDFIFAGAAGIPFGGTRSDDFFCPGKKVGKALRGKYGSYIDSVSFVCDEWNR